MNMAFLSKLLLLNGDDKRWCEKKTNSEKLVELIMFGAKNTSSTKI